MAGSIDALASYLPGLILRRLADRAPAPLGPDIERSRAAVLFADISGFTSLTERLAARGAGGPEELSAALNAYFDRVIEAIADHGGDVVKMAGDALIALWPARAEGDSPATATLRAVRCALEMQATLKDYRVAEGVHLSSKAGIGAGEVVAMLVGGERDRWELLVAGSPLVQMGEAEHRARPGDVVLSREAWDLVRDRCAGEPLDEGHVLLRRADAPPPKIPANAGPPKEDGESIRAFIPAAIRERLAAGQTAWLAELRRLTILFVNLPPTDCDRPDALERAQAIMRALQAGTYRHAGSVNKLSVDEKGTTLVAALGLPPLAHPDDPKRGILAARAIVEALDPLGIRPAIGIATGRVYCGEVGNNRRREYTIIGRSVNLAARLMQAAQDNHETFCDEETFRSARGCFEFDALPPRRLKNIESPVAIFRPGGEVAHCGESRPSVGRQFERAALASRLGDLRSGRGGLVVIEGEPGIGKSQLLDDLASRARESAVPTIAGGGDAVERTTPYHAWRPVFEAISGVTQDLALEDRRARAASFLGPEPLAPLLNAVLPIDLPEDDLTAHMTGQVRADNTNDLLARILRNAAERSPTVLILDDGHWMDSASWALTLLVARSPGPTLLVVAMRPHDASSPDQHRDLVAIADERISLNALPPADAIELAARRLEVAELPATVADLIVRKSQGNPFCCEEIAHALRESGRVIVEGGRCRVAPGGDLETFGIPDNVEAIVNARIDRLTPSQQLALKVASVIGRYFAVRLLRDVYPIAPERPAIPGQLDSLTRLELILPERAELDPTYLFRHVITRDVVYDQMAFAQRRRLHRDVAEWYERIRGDDLSPHYPLLAHHWSQAKDAARAVGYLEKAGEQALRGGAYREAVEFLGLALAFVEAGRAGAEAGRRARWEYQLGEAHLALGHLGQSREHAGRALALLGRPIPPRAGLAGGLLAQAALQALRRVAPSTSHGGDPDGGRRLASTAFGLVGQLCYFEQERALGVYAAIRSLNLAEPEAGTAELARGLAVMCIACGLVPAHGMAEVYRRRAYSVAAGLEDVAARAWVLQLTGMYDLGIGRWDRGRENLEEAVAINRKLGDWRRWEESSGELARLDYYVGRYAESAARFEEFGREAHRRGHGQAHAWGLHGRAKGLLRMGRHDEALALLDESRALPGESIGISDAILRDGQRALILAERGDWLAAGFAADETSRLIAQSPPMVAYSFEGYAGAADAYLAIREARPDGDVTPRRLRKPLSALARIARIYPMGRPRARICRGKAQWLAGRKASALRSWRAALRDAEALAMPFEQGLALREIGRRLGPGDPAGREAIDRAAAIFEGLGARHHLALTRAAGRIPEVN